MNKEIVDFSSAELLSSYCDRILKPGGDKAESDFDSLLDKVDCQAVAEVQSALVF